MYFSHQNSSSAFRLYRVNGVLLIDITGYDRLKFSWIYTIQNEILDTPLIRGHSRRGEGVRPDLWTMESYILGAI